MCASYPELDKLSKICDKCRKETSLIKEKEQHNASNSSSDEGNDPNFTVPQSVVVNTLNSSLVQLGESPVDCKKMKSKQYSARKIKKIECAVKRQLFDNSDSSSEVDESEKLNESILINLKKAFLDSNSRKKKVMLLTCLPDSWSVRKIMREFNAPNYMVRQAKKILNEKGILESPNQRPGKSLPKEVVQAVHTFYENDEISRVMPGKKDCKVVKDNTGEKALTSKRLILGNLKEIYFSFKNKYPDLKIGFSKFAELRPSNCILVGQSGTHSVCVCTIHQNVKLMFENAKLNDVTDGLLATYKHCLANMLCNPPSIDCCTNNCSSCPGVEKINTILKEKFEEKIIEKITFRQWVTVDRCSLETFEKNTSEFIELFCDKITVLVCHDFIARQQSSFMNDTKGNLKDGEFCVIGDFSENFSFVIQDEAQGYHWASDHATIHPYVIYFKEENKIQHTSYVIISDCLEHTTAAVYCFQKKLIQFLKGKFDHVRKIYYFSDGCAGQYKNKKNFSNLCYHNEDFDVEAEWHFFATSHGKGPCDGVGGTLKRLATKASLQRPFENQILTPKDLFDWAVENVKSVNFEFSTQEDHIEAERFLEKRFSYALTIKGTQKLHAFIPLLISTSRILVKSFSNSSESRIEKLNASEKLQLADVSGYVTAIYDDKWWLAYVMAKNEEDDEVKLTFLHPAGPAPSFTFPRKPDILWLCVSSILCKVNPVTQTGRVYKIQYEEEKKTHEALEIHRSQ